MGIDGGFKATTNQAQLKNQIKHLAFQEIIQMLADVSPNPQGGFGNSRVSNADVRTVTATPDLVTPTDFLIIVNAGVATENLPSCADGGRLLFIINKGTSTAVTPNGSDTIDGGGAVSLTHVGEYLVLFSDTTSDWKTLGRSIGHGVPILVGDTAGGDLTGTYPDPDVRSISKMTVPTTKTTDYTAVKNDFMLIFDTTAGNINLTLPAASANKQMLIVKKLSAANVLYVIPSGADTTEISNITGDNSGFILVSDGVGKWRSVNTYSTDRILGVALYVGDPSVGNIIAGQGAYWQNVPAQGNVSVDANGNFFVKRTTFQTGTGLTATGSVQGDALLMLDTNNVVTTTAAGTGVIMYNYNAGFTYFVTNAGANTLKIYPPSSAQINSLGANVAFSLESGSSIIIEQSSSTQYYTHGYAGTGTLSTAIKKRVLSFTWDGGGAVCATGSTCGVVFPYAGTITGWDISAVGSSPTCTIDVWKIASGTALPTVSNTIMGTKPALSTGNVNESTTLTSWTTSVAAGDIFIANLDAVTVATKITFQIEIGLS